MVACLFVFIFWPSLAARGDLSSPTGDGTRASSGGSVVSSPPGPPGKCPLFVRDQQGFPSACSAGDLGSIPRSGRSPGGGHGNLLQYSCLKNPMDRGAWRVTAHGVTKSRTRLKRLSNAQHVNSPGSDTLSCGVCICRDLGCPLCPPTLPCPTPHHLVFPSDPVSPRSFLSPTPDPYHSSSSLTQQLQQ